MQTRIIDGLTGGLESLHEDLAEAVAWCEAKGRLEDPRGSLRSLPPPGREVDLGLLESRRRLVDGVCWSRRTALKGAGIAGVSPRWPELPGKLLVFFPDEDTADGGAELQTAGFFDVHNTPPWDTWIRFFTDLRETAARTSLRGYLLAYVPASLVGLAARGVAVNPERCIEWLSDSDTALLDVLP